MDSAAPLSRLALVAALAFAAMPAAALDIGDVDLLSFPTGVPPEMGNTGFTNPGLVPDFATNPMTERICAGAAPFVSGSSSACQGTGYDITITQNLQTVHQFPQGRGNQPSDTSPFIADSLWMATNTSQETYPQVLLLFTQVNLLNYAGSITKNGYPDLEVGLDGNLLDIVQFTAMTPMGSMDYFFGAVDLGKLAPGESRQFTVRYIVSSGAMPIVRSALAINQVVMPPLKLVAQVVPEPGTSALLLTGLAGIGFAGRKR